MEERKLRHFLAVAETLHFGRAAERLGITQPPLSQSIKALEDELGVTLFTRTKRAVALTPAGADWLPHARAALEALDGLPDLARRFQEGLAGRLALSFVSTADYSILPALVRRFTAAYPAIELALTEATSDVQLAEIAEGRMDAGLIIPPSDSVMRGNLGYRRILLEPLVAAVPQSWIGEGRLPESTEELTPALIASQPMILFPRRVAPAFHDLVLTWCSAAGAPPRITQEAIQMQTIISLVSAGLGLALVPASLKNLARTGVRYLDLPSKDKPLLETGIAWNKKRETPALENLLEIAGEEASR